MSRLRLPLLLALFTLSGAAGLAWEVVLVKVLATRVGAGLEVVGVVTAAFLAGLALGGAGAGVAVRRLGPVRAFAIGELCAAAWLSLVLTRASSLVDGLAAAEGAAGLLGIGLVVIPGAVGLGVTWPALVAATGARPRIAALLYGVNALGAAGGALLAGLVIAAPYEAGALACAVDLVVAVVALALLSTEDAPAPRARADVPARFFWVATAGGFVGVGLEVVWTRLAGPAWVARFEGDATAFSGVLAALLLGGGLGGVWVAGQPPERARALLPWTLVAVGLTTLLAIEPGRALLPRGAYLLDGFAPVLPALAAGTVFPTLAVGVLDADPRWRRAAALYALNTAGAVAGGLVVAFIGVPVLGAQAVAVLLAAAALGIGALAADRFRVVITGAAVAVAALVVVVPPVAGARLLRPEERLLTAIDGRQATTLVAERPGGERLLVSGGHRIASAQGAPIDDHGLRASAADLARSTDRVLLIGLGTGETAAALLRRADVAHLRIVEIDGNQASLLTWFDTAWVLDDPRVELVVADARRHLRRDQARWDLILVDAYGPRTASVVFYTRDFYAEARSRLSPDGTLAVKLDPLSIPDAPTLHAYLAAFFVWPDSRLVYARRGLFWLLGGPGAVIRAPAVDVADAGRAGPLGPPVTDARPHRVGFTPRPVEAPMRALWLAAGHAGLPPWEADRRGGR